jgi:Pyruvate/2-oxoacid:ferredoxin oxidoreductase delta subunit
LNDEVVVNRLIIPPAEAEKLVSRAGSVYLRDCPCRLEMQVCPPEKWKVCLLFEHAGEEDRQKARLISNAEAVEIVRKTTARGDIHQLFYFEEGGRPFELCNCCDCCCFPLREARDKGDGYRSQLRSGYVSVTDTDLCTDCGDCVDSCFFSARQITEDALHFVDALCFGCGSCLLDCQEDAIRLEYQPERGIPIPTFGP